MENLNLRDVINSSNIFYRDEELRKNYDLICAVMDRVDDSVAYIKHHKELPDEPNDILLFLMHSAIIKDAVSEILNKLELGEIQEDKNYFINVCKNEPLYLAEEEIPTDDKFFEYIRSLAFAHPLQTNRPKFFLKNETQYSPFIIRGTYVLEKNNIGLRVYSNKRAPGAFTIHIPFNDLKNYIIERYNILNSVIAPALKQKIDDKENEWRKQKVNRNLPNEDILKDIKSIFESRYWETYDIDMLINLLTYSYSEPNNNTSIQKTQMAIIDKIPQLCDYTDNLETDAWWESVKDILHASPSNMHESAHYEIEKIFSYLNSRANEMDWSWGLRMAKSFYEQFAKKWVVINFDVMKYNEIKLLVKIALYLEFKEQQKTCSASI